MAIYEVRGVCVLAVRCVLAMRQGWRRRMLPANFCPTLLMLP